MGMTKSTTREMIVHQRRRKKKRFAFDIVDGGGKIVDGHLESLQWDDGVKTIMSEWILSLPESIPLTTILLLSKVK